MSFPVNTPDNLFHDGDPATNTPGTVVTADWLNTVQASIIAMGFTVRMMSGAGLITNADGVIFCDSSSGTFTLTLPTTSGLFAGKRFYLKNIASIATGNDITIATPDTKTIDEALSLTIMPRESCWIIYNGTNWETM